MSECKTWRWLLTEGGSPIDFQMQIFLSEASLGATITTAKSSAINVSAPDGHSGDMKEQYIPEQFVSRLVNGALKTVAAEHGGG